MKIAFANPDKVNGLLTLTVEEQDYKEKVEKLLKDYRKKANIPGFRPGMAPIGMIKKQVGTQVKVDVLNKIVSEEMFKYIKENSIQMLGEPMTAQSQVPQDLEKDTEFTFVFDIAVAPEFTAQLTANDTITYYNIVADDALINRQIEMFAQRQGSLIKAEVYEGNDILVGDLRELDAEGNTLEGGVTLSEARIMPSYISDAEQQALFNGSKLGDIITINPRKMYGDAEFAALLKMEKEEAEKHTGDFSYQITEISHHQPAEVNQQLFDAVFGEGVCEDEAAFRAKIAEGLGMQLQADADNKFLFDVRQYLEASIGTLTYPDALLKRIMLASNEGKDEEFVEQNYEASIKHLTWHLIKEQLVAANEIKVDEADLKAVAIESARVMFAQYGMNNAPEEYLEDYADKMLKDKKATEGIVERAIDVKLIQALKNVVNLDIKTVTIDEFSRLIEEK